jgi:hypothetical protein
VGGQAVEQAVPDETESCSPIVGSRPRRADARPKRAGLAYGRAAVVHAARMSDPKGELTVRSDQLLTELAHLKDTEARKRQAPISSPPFHELAEEVNESSRRIFAISTEQDQLGEEAATGTESIEDIERSG